MVRVRRVSGGDQTVITIRDTINDYILPRHRGGIFIAPADGKALGGVLAATVVERGVRGAGQAGVEVPDIGNAETDLSTGCDTCTIQFS